VVKKKLLIPAVAALGVVFLIAAGCLALVQWHTDGVPCGNAFHESGQAFQEDLRRTSPLGGYTVEGSFVARCARVRATQQLVSLAAAAAGIGATGAGVGLFLRLVVNDPRRTSGRPPGASRPRDSHGSQRWNG
jgi:hypothetical protein